MGPRPFGQGGPRPAGSFGQGGPRPMGPRPGMGRKGPELVPTVEKERVSNYDPNKKLYMRQHDPERVARNRKQLVRENGIGFDDESCAAAARSASLSPSSRRWRPSRSKRHI